MSDMNKELNPSRMTDEIREKVRQSRIGKGSGKSYPRIYGRHMHRIMAEEILGRKLEPGEVVHHKDGNKQNYDKDNLTVFESQKEHAKMHRKEDGGRFK